ncbi:hypothetical protein [Plasticicumulans sp.]|uniref:hypothetical protein n=1 Tax=Plasticicumulans sp. TaxID=2307179 RepID=UPI0039392CD4
MRSRRSWFVLRLALVPPAAGGTPSAAGDARHPFCCALGAAAGQAPRRSFRKDRIDRPGRLVASFPAQTGPQDPTLLTAIEKLL